MLVIGLIGGIAMGYLFAAFRWFTERRVWRRQVNYLIKCTEDGLDREAYLNDVQIDLGQRMEEAKEVIQARIETASVGVPKHIFAKDTLAALIRARQILRDGGEKSEGG